MSGLFYTFNIAKRGMAAQQTSLHVTSHNVSNIGTEGYSRQRAVHKTTQPYPMPSLNNAVIVFSNSSKLISSNSLIFIGNFPVDFNTEITTETGRLTFISFPLADLIKTLNIFSSIHFLKKIPPNKSIP